MNRYVYFLEKDDGNEDIVCYDTTKGKYKWIVMNNVPSPSKKWEGGSQKNFKSIKEIDRIFSITNSGGQFLGSFDTLDNPVEVLYG